MQFEKDFKWGLATASIQVEGAYNQDGRSESIWDNPSDGRVANNDKPHIASDQYHHYKEDVKIMKDLGINTYRFSLSWSRIIPERNKINQKGIDYYNSLINELIQNNIEPMITIYHWDMPMWVYKLGGWESEEIISVFKEYVEVVSKNFSDRVKYWFVYNEPQCFILNGYLHGKHAPFKKKFFSLGKITKIMMKAHGVGVKTLREHAKQDVKVGIAMAVGSFIPVNDTKEEIEKAYQKTFDDVKGYIPWLCDPILKGKPAKTHTIHRIDEKEIEDIYQPLDFLGINHYLPMVDKNYVPLRKERSCMDWIIDERAIYWTIRFFYERYKLPIIVSENGTALYDEVVDGRVDDKQRSEYITNYLRYVKKAKEENIPVQGYIYWSYIDNFEWQDGYKPRFGLVHCDYDNGCKRTIKDSAYTYKHIIETNGEEL